MVFYAGRSSCHPAMQTPPWWSSPTATTSTTSCSPPSPLRRSCWPDARAGRSRDDLRDLLQVDAGGVVFTTMQKFLPDVRGDRPAALRPPQHRGDRRRGPPQPVRVRRRFRPPSARRPAQRLVHRLHRHAHRADDKNTRAVFGDYISIYDIQHAVDDGATVPIYYESRLAKLDPRRRRASPPRRRVRGGDRRRGGRGREKLKTKWAQLEALVGAERADRPASPPTWSPTSSAARRPWRARR